MLFIYIMFEIWAKLGLILGGLVLAAVLWFVLTVVCKAIFEDIVGGTARKLKQQLKTKINRDHYQY